MNYANIDILCIPQESVGLPEQTAAEAAKVKGVQFPFVVGDRVMIKVINQLRLQWLFFLVVYKVPTFQ
jgi:hypothetical protein